MAFEWPSRACCAGSVKTNRFYWPALGFQYSEPPRTFPGVMAAASAFVNCFDQSTRCFGLPPGPGQQNESVPFRGAEPEASEYADAMSAIFPPWPRLALAGCSLILGAGLLEQTAAAEPGMASQPAYDVTNVLQVVRLSSENPNVSHSIRLEGTVWWANAAQ